MAGVVRANDAPDRLQEHLRVLEDLQWKLVDNLIRLYENESEYASLILEHQRDRVRVIGNFEMWHEQMQECPDYKTHHELLSRTKKAWLEGSGSRVKIMEGQAALGKRLSDLKDIRQSGQFQKEWQSRSEYLEVSALIRDYWRQWRVMEIVRIQILLDHQNFNPSPDIYSFTEEEL